MKGESEKRVVVSLTSFPGAIEYAAGAVRSILAGSVLPDKIVLYVTMRQFDGKPLPSELIELERNNEIFEIRNYDFDIRSYCELIPAIADFPNATIVTIDDDVYYHRDMLKVLLRLHVEFPQHIIAHRAKRIAFGQPYKKWKKYRWYHFLTKRIIDRADTLQTGVGGALYPPGSLDASMLDPEQFTRLAPTTDDIWFWAAAVANDRRVIPVPFGYNKPKSLGKPRELSLKTVNFKSGTDRNTAALQNIIKHYPKVARYVEK